MNRIGIVFALVALAGTSACTTSLTARRVESDSALQMGYPYRLKFTQYEITLTRRIADCGGSQRPDRKPKDPENPVDIQITAAFQEKAAFDPQEFYTIDPRELAGWFKTTDAKFEWYEDRSLKSANVTVQDHTAQVISNVVTGAAKLASIGLAAGGASKCNAEVLKALEKISEVKPKVEKAQATLDDATAALAQVVAKVAAMGSAVDNTTKRLLAKKMKEVETATAHLAAEKKVLERHLKVVSYVKKVSWPTNARDRVSDPDEVPDTVLEGWGVSSSNETKKGLAVIFTLAPVGGSPAAPTDADSLPATVKGLPYREPVLTRLSVCTKAACKRGDPNEVSANEGLVLQTGQVLVLPFEGRTFASMTSTAGFDKNGVLQSAGYAQTAAPAVGASEVFKNTVDQVAGVVDTAKGARTKQAQAELAELNAQKALADAKAAPNPDQAAIKAFETQAALAKAELAALQAEQALAQAKAAAPR